VTRRKSRQESWTDSSPPGSGQGRVNDSDTMLPAAGHATTPAPPPFPADHGNEVDRETAGAELADDAFDPPTLNERRSSPIASDAPSSFRPRLGEAGNVPSDHLRGLLEALVFASDKPIPTAELARLSSAPLRQVRELLADLKATYSVRGIVLDEIAGGWLFRTSVQYAPFVRQITGARPVRLSRAQIETLSIVAYRQPVTRPEIDDIRGVDSGATLKLLLERDLLRILGKKDEAGRPLLYGTTRAFLEFFGLKSLKELPTLREFTELSEESQRLAEVELADIAPEGDLGAEQAPVAEDSGAFEPEPGGEDSPID